MSANQAILLKNIPNSSEEDLKTLDEQVNKHVNHAGAVLIGGLGNESPISTSQFRSLSPTEKVDMINNILHPKLREKHDSLFNKLREVEKEQGFQLQIATFLSILNLTVNLFDCQG